MPPQSGSSEFFQKYGNAAFQGQEKHANDPMPEREGGLPAGIENGVAQLNHMRFQKIGPGKTNAGEWMFYADAVVKSPEEHDGVQCKGGRTFITETMCNTPKAKNKTVSDHMGRVYDELRLLGIKTEKIPKGKVEDFFKMLEQSKPHLYFRTWKGSKQTTGPYKDREPRVNHVWLGLAEWNENGQPSDGVQVDENPEPPPDDVGDQGDVDQAPPPADDGDYDLDVLGAAADGGDTDAEAKIKEIALACGFTWEEKVCPVRTANTWTEAVEVIKAGPQEEPQPEEPSGPDAGNRFHFFPMDPRTKKPVAKPVEVEVVSTDHAKQMAKCKNGKVTYQIAYDKLVPIKGK